MTRNIELYNENSIITEGFYSMDGDIAKLPKNLQKAENVIFSYKYSERCLGLYFRCELGSFSCPQYAAIFLVKGVLSSLRKLSR